MNMNSIIVGDEALLKTQLISHTPNSEGFLEANIVSRDGKTLDGEDNVLKFFEEDIFYRTGDLVIMESVVIAVNGDDVDLKVLSTFGRDTVRESMTINQEFVNVDGKY